MSDQIKDKPLTDSIDIILDGIDRDEIDGGWWATSVGVEFGARKKAGVKEYIKDLDSSRQRLITAAKAYLEPQPNDSQSERVHAELVEAIKEAEKL